MRIVRRAHHPFGYSRSEDTSCRGALQLPEISETTAKPGASKLRTQPHLRPVVPRFLRDDQIRLMPARLQNDTLCFNLDEPASW
jgi:hypothetical protein